MNQTSVDAANGATGRDRGLALPLEGWSDISRVERPERDVLLFVAATGITFDVAIRSGFVGVGGAAIFVVTAVGLLATGKLPSVAARTIAASGVLVGAFVAVRASGWLLALDVVVAVALIAIAATFARGGNPFDLTVPHLLGRGLHVVGHAVLAPAYPLRAATRGRVPAGVLRGTALAAPIVLVLGALLSSADAVFASFLQVPTDAGDLALHGVLLVVGAWWASTLFRIASGEDFRMPVRQRPMALGGQETTTVLLGLAGVLSLFAASQAVAFVRGAGYVERTSGLSYAEYARTGFFQLLAVGFVSLATLWALRRSLRGRAHVNLALIACAGNVVIVAVAVRRLFLYEAAYGLTALRLVAVLVALWLGIVFVLTAVVAARPPERQWLLPASVAVGVAVLAAANVVNVEAFIVERNVARFAGTSKLDVGHLTSLSDDAVPALVARWDELSVEEQAAAAQTLCRDHRSDRRTSWVSANLARSRADRALEAVCAAGGHR